MSVVAAPTPILQFFANTGAPNVNGSILTQVGGVNATTYQDAGGTIPLPNPIPLNSRGEVSNASGLSCQLFLTSGQVYTFTMFDANGNQLNQAQYVVSNSQPTQASIGGLLYPQTAQEIAAGVTPANYAYQNGPMRYGATGTGTTCDNAAWQQMVEVEGYNFVPNGTYLICAPVLTSQFLTIEGTDRQNTILTPSSACSGPMLQVGSVALGPNPNVGELKRLRFVGGLAQTSALLYMEELSHLWRLNELLFSGDVNTVGGTGCPALVVNNCWDSNYTNIDVYSCGYPNQPANIGAAVQIINGSNNLYFRGLHIEGCPSGALYLGVGCTPIIVTQGKIDLGFIPQVAAAVTIGSGSYLIMTDFTVTGTSSSQYSFSVQGGSLKLDNMYVTGGTGAPAHILDQRTWSQVNSGGFPTYTAQSYGPSIGAIELGLIDFGVSAPSQVVTTPAVVNSKIPGFRYVTNFTVTASSSASATTTNVATNLPAQANGWYIGMYLVHNPTGTVTASGNLGSRRYVTASFGSSLVVAGNWLLTADSDWSLEYQAGHYTPNFTCSQIQPGQDIFAVLYYGCTPSGTPTYVASSGGATGGATNFQLSGPAANADLTGYYLVDEVTGEPFFITYGIDGSGFIAVAYDRTKSINTQHTYSIVGGYAVNAQMNGTSVEWTFAGKKKTALYAAMKLAGFGANDIPVWGFGQTGEPVNVNYSASITLDASQTHLPIITATNSTAFTINAPINLCNGDRIVYTIKNNSGGALGTLTWNSIFKMAAWVQPASGFNASIEFRYDGTNLVEINRSGTTVPN